MTQPHVRLDATYRLLPQTRDDAYAVEVSVHGMSPITVSGFITQASAERWVVEHHERWRRSLQADSLPGPDLRSRGNNSWYVPNYRDRFRDSGGRREVDCET